MQSLLSHPPGQPLDFATVEAFCKQGVREGRFIDYKADFPADLAKMIASLANTDGGLVLIGVVADKKTNAPTLPLQGVALAPDLEEKVYKICGSSIYPPIAPLVWLVNFSDTNLSQPERAILVVRVLPSDLAPHAVDKRRGVYVRTGNISQPYEQATADEILQLSNRRAEASVLRRELIAQARRRFQFFKERRFADPDDVRHGLVHCADTQVAICPKYPGRTIASVQQIVEWLRMPPCRKRGIEGFDFFPPVGEAQPVQDAAMFKTAANSNGLEVTEVGTRGLISHGFYNKHDEWFAVHATGLQLGA